MEYKRQTAAFLGFKLNISVVSIESDLSWVPLILYSEASYNFNEL